MVSFPEKIAFAKQQAQWAIESAQKDCDELTAKIAEVAQNPHTSFANRAAYIGQLTHDLQKAAARLTAADEQLRAIKFITD